LDWLERLNRRSGRIAAGHDTVEILHWAHAPHLPDNRPHRHTFFEACLVGDHGAGVFIVQNQEHPIGPGQLFLARPGFVHQIRNTTLPDMELYWVCFQWVPVPAETKRAAETEFDTLLRTCAESPVVVTPDERGRLRALWTALRAIADGPADAAFEMQVSALAAALVIGIAQAASGQIVPLPEPVGPEAGEAAARLAVRFIHDNLSRPLSLAEIAAQVYVSPRHLARLFQHWTGVTPTHYVTHARMDRAQNLIRHSSLPIKEVAIAVGYPDVHHFTRVFTLRFGCPPAKLRRHPERFSVLNIQTPGDLV
jgi:AraC-like DNA-binding protein/mannose-6-phosphate isomerase-like protein (cupin superfamily)